MLSEFITASTLKRPLSPVALRSLKKILFSLSSGVERSEKGDGFELCSMCNLSFSITVGEKNDIT